MEYRPDFPEEEERGLVRLSRVTYELAEGQPDAMGWRAADAEGVEFGSVSDMLADSMSGQIVFVAVTFDAPDRTALVPVEGLYLDLTARVLVVPCRRSDIQGCPDFTDQVVDLMSFVDYWTKVTAG